MDLEFFIEHNEVYTMTPDDGSPEVHILSGELRKWLLEHAMHCLTVLHFPAEELTDEYLEKRLGCEVDRLVSMTEEEAQEPIILGIWGSDSHFIIDGAHRRAFWAKRGIHTMKGWVLPPEVWSQFQIDFDNLGPEFFVKRDGSSLPQRRKK